MHRASPRLQTKPSRQRHKAPSRQRTQRPIRITKRQSHHHPENETRTHTPSYSKIKVPSEYLHQSLATVSTALAAGHVTSEQLTTSCLEQIKATNSISNAYLTVLTDQALDAARASDARRRGGKVLSPLDGVAISIKDNFHVKDAPTTAGSKFLSNMISPYDATVVQRLKDAGAVIIGKTNMDEFGMGSYGKNSAFGPTVHYFSTQEQDNSAQHYVPGGSSSGSAVSVAQYTAWASIGSDTGGSVRLPAAYTGVIGLKPTYGALSRYGLIAYGSSFDCPGVIARTPQDAYLIFRTIAGADVNDSTCIFNSPIQQTITSNQQEQQQQQQQQEPQPKQHHRIQDVLGQTLSSATSITPINSSHYTSKHPLHGLKVGIPKELMFDDLSHDIKTSWVNMADTLTELGAQVYTVSIPALEHALPVYYSLVQSEAVSNLACYDGLRYGRSHYTNDPSYKPGFYYHDDTSTSPDADVSQQSLSSSLSSSSSDLVEEKEVILLPEQSTNVSALQKFYSTNRQMFFGPEVRRRILSGNFALSSTHYNAYITQSMNLREKLTADVLSTLVPENTPHDAQNDADNNCVDVLLCPTSTTATPTFDELHLSQKSNPMIGYMDDTMTVFANLTGVPAVSVPVTTVKRQIRQNADSDEQVEVELPISMQFIGAPLTEIQLLNIAHIVQTHNKL